MTRDRDFFQKEYPALASACWHFNDPKHPASDPKLAESYFADLPPRQQLRQLTELVDDAHRFLEIIEEEYDLVSDAAGRTFESHHEARNFLIDALLVWRTQLEWLKTQDLPPDPPSTCAR